MNQNIEKTDVKSGKILPLMETFTTIKVRVFIVVGLHIFYELADVILDVIGAT